MVKFLTWEKTKAFNKHLVPLEFEKIKVLSNSSKFLNK